MAAEPSDGGRGHAARPHTADAVIEAWGPTAAACYEEAVAAFAELFVDAASCAGSTSHVFFDLGPDRPERLLVRLLEEALALVDGDGLVPLSARVDAAGDRLSGSFTATPVAGLVQIGPQPKGVSYHGLAFEHAAGGWRCTATVDV